MTFPEKLYDVVFYDPLTEDYRTITDEPLTLEEARIKARSVCSDGGIIEIVDSETYQLIEVV